MIGPPILRHNEILICGFAPDDSNHDYGTTVHLQSITISKDHRTNVESTAIESRVCTEREFASVSR